MYSRNMYSQLARNLQAGDARRQVLNAMLIMVGIAADKKKQNVPQSIAKKIVSASVAKNKSPCSSPKEKAKKSTAKKPSNKPSNRKVMVSKGESKVQEEEAKKTSAKRAAPAAAPLLRRNTTLQTRGKDEDSKFRPKSRTTGPVVDKKKTEPPLADSSSKSKKRSAPLSDSGSGAPASLAKVARIELSSNQGKEIFRHFWSLRATLCVYMEGLVVNGKLG